jgi:hypothetical protein
MHDPELRLIRIMAPRLSSSISSRVLAAILLAGGLVAGCGGSSSGKLAVDSPMNTFVPPEESDLVPEAEEPDEPDDATEPPADGAGDM